MLLARIRSVFLVLALIVNNFSAFPLYPDYSNLCSVHLRTELPCQALNSCLVATQIKNLTDIYSLN